MHASKQDSKLPAQKVQEMVSSRMRSEPECAKIARFSAAAVAIFTAPQKIARFFEAPRCAISSAKKIASEPRFLLRIKWVKMALAAEFLAIPSSAVKIASERRCAILVHSDQNEIRICIIWRHQGTRQGSIPGYTRICLVGVPDVLKHFKNRETPVRFGSVAVWGWNGSSGSGFRFRQFRRSFKGQHD